MEKAIAKMEKWQKGMEKSLEFGFLSDLLEKFPQAEVYLVGGAVRDIILDRETKDFDFVIGNVKADELEKFLAGLGEVNLVGKSFGVFKFVPTGFHVGDNNFEALDIALPRTEVAGMSGGYKDFEVQSDPSLPIEDDLGRRDFTINALAWDIKNKKLIDEFSGVKDLEQSIIRAIGDPEQRFQEDYTRMLRAVRFSCQLGFKIESKTLKAINLKA